MVNVIAKFVFTHDTHFTDETLPLKNQATLTGQFFLTIAR
jgi:hypothetical protein